MGLHHKLVTALRFPFLLPQRLRCVEANLLRLESNLHTLEEGVRGLGNEIRSVGAELPEIRGALAALTTELTVVQGEVEALRDQRLPEAEARLDQIEVTLRGQQRELEQLRDHRTGELERRLDTGEERLRGIGNEMTRLRDQVLPAVVDRGNALIDRLADELEEVASLTSRLALREPLPVPLAEPAEGRLVDGLCEVQALVLEAFRGDETRILHRLDRYLDPLAEAAPVLDLGSGRGELLVLLREAGVSAAGVESDEALAAEALRRGLRVTHDDALAFLERQGAGAWGAVTAIHLLEHLPAASLLATLREVRRVLRPGGLLVAECPNPHCLRVGAALYWRDPTHQRPLLPETLELFLQASGFEILSRTELHPFPVDQRLARDGATTASEVRPDVADLERRLDRLTHRLDDLLNGPRDFSILARAPDSTTH